MTTRTDQASELITRFLARDRRYLWTDAFATCTLLGLGRADLARDLVDRVHHVLGTHRPDDARTGWISGLPPETAEQHPTLGGLRIGKPLPERAPGEPYDDRLEWDRDGQYFHYLTKWMHALDQTARATGETRYSTWARELAEAAFRTFVDPRRRRMVWKMSIDLARPLVPSMGQHDPLDGLVTCLALDQTAAELGARGPDLADAVSAYAGMVAEASLATADPLGIGGLLADASRLAQLPRTSTNLVRALVDAAELGLDAFAEGRALDAPASRRLAFRELGLSIGLAAADGVIDDPRLAPYRPLRARIEETWLDPVNRRTRVWVEHEDINDVMLATSLAPDGFVRREICARPAHGPGVQLA